MLCENCPYHKYDVGMEDADEYCDIFGDYIKDGIARKDEEGCRFNLRTLKKKKAEKDEEFVRLFNPDRVE